MKTAGNKYNYHEPLTISTTAFS